MLNPSARSMDDTDDTQDRGDATPITSERQIAQDNWERYEYGRGRGHRDYCRKARELEGMFLAAGRQWLDSDRAVLDEEQRPALEFNELTPAIKAAIGYQIANRADISFAPRGGQATQELATTIGKVVMQIVDNCRAHWLETDVFSDGIIQRRGYFEVRVSFDDNMRGEVALDTLDPLDVVPDPDAKTYDPSGWGDVITTRWMSLDDIEQRYGKVARQKAELSAANLPEQDFGEDEDSEARNKFGNSTDSQSWDYLRRDKSLVRVRIIERQRWVYQQCDVAVSIETGDVRVLDGMSPGQQAQLLQTGFVRARRMAKRVRWTVTTWDQVLFDDWSPYPFFTVVPYFPIFRRGETRGMVDPAVDPQRALNKLGSQLIHIVNSAANSGWKVEQDSLTNMDTDNLETEGSKNGLVVEFKKGSTPPEKIQPSQIPTGHDRLFQQMAATIKANTLPDAARGVGDSGDTSGLMLQIRQYAAQQQMAPELDNLARTRHMLAERLLYLVQTYYDTERVIRITKTDPRTGKKLTEELRINYYDEQADAITNDLTVGEYDVVITEVPMQVTFENGQFEQLLKMRELGIRVPDHSIVQSSNYANKADLLEDMAAQGEQADPVAEADAALKQAQAKKTDADATKSNVEAQFSAIQTAQTIAQIPQTAQLADALLKSAGYVDHDAPPIVPAAAGGILDGIPPPQLNTNPLTPRPPATPGVGERQGIETQRSDSVL